MNIQYDKDLLANNFQTISSTLPTLSNNLHTLKDTLPFSNTHSQFYGNYLLKKLFFLLEIVLIVPYHLTFVLNHKLHSDLCYRARFC